MNVSGHVEPAPADSTSTMRDSGRAPPPGQRVRHDHPSFGLPWFALKVPREIGPLALQVRGAVSERFIVGIEDVRTLRRTEQCSDFHCVTTWSREGARWSGYRFSEFYEQIVKPRIPPGTTVDRIRFDGADGYHDTMLLTDLLAPRVVLADAFDGRSLTAARGAPVRLVAPDHYGYKNVKNVVSMELLTGAQRRRPRQFAIHHPRGRVAFEERAWGAPTRLVRPAYARSVTFTVWWYQLVLAVRGPRD